MTISEIASKMGLDVALVKKAYASAIKKLREKLPKEVLRDLVSIS